MCRFEHLLVCVLTYQTACFVYIPCPGKCTLCVYMCFVVLSRTSTCYLSLSLYNYIYIMSIREREGVEEGGWKRGREGRVGREGGWGGRERGGAVYLTHFLLFSGFGFVSFEDEQPAEKVCSIQFHDICGKKVRKTLEREGEGGGRRGRERRRGREGGRGEEGEKVKEVGRGRTEGGKIEPGGQGRMEKRVEKECVRERELVL